jgi:hypothetical protein
MNAESDVCGMKSVEGWMEVGGRERRLAVVQIELIKRGMKILVG